MPVGVDPADAPLSHALISRAERSKSIPFKAGTVQYLMAVDRETLNSEHQLVSSQELHSRRQPVVVST